MWRGAVVSVHIARAAREPMIEIDPARAVARRGLEGDRYYEGKGFYSDHPGPIREVSLIEEETIQALRRDHGLVPGATRRNILTRGVHLNHLIEREFRVGEATLRGVELCEPCKHVVDVTGITGLLPALVHGGGLHARILSGGRIRAGDAIEPAGGVQDTRSWTYPARSYDRNRSRYAAMSRICASTQSSMVLSRTVSRSAFARRRRSWGGMVRAS